MYTDFREINALYHHGIKGQKWGIIRKKDSETSRETTQRDRLNYDAKIARYEGELAAVKDNNKTDLSIAKEETKRTVNEGKVRVAEAMSQANVDKTRIKAEKDAKIKKYATIGITALLALGVVSGIANKYFSTKSSIARNDNKTITDVAKMKEGKAPATKTAITKAAKDAASSIKNPARKGGSSPKGKAADTMITINKPLWQINKSLFKK